MVILDTNIFIYLANGTLRSELVAGIDLYYASVTKIEALGHANITARELNIIDALFAESELLALNDRVIGTAIKLRQLQKMGLGDAIIAATALENNGKLWTANIKDFKHIDGLQLINPLG